MHSGLGSAGEVRPTLISKTTTNTLRILDDGTLVFALLELVKYLGHPNPVVSGVAFNEVAIGHPLLFPFKILTTWQILSLARAGDVCVQQLFDPFWDVVAYYAVKDLITRPQTTQSMAELLDIDVVQFLLLIQSSSLPYLVLNQDLEVIVRISQARQDDDRSQVLFQASNLVKILALLLQQNTIDTEKSTLALLGAYDAKFKDSDLADLMKVEPSTTAFYLLMAAGEADAGVKSRVRLPSSLGINKHSHLLRYVKVWLYWQVMLQARKEVRAKRIKLARSWNNTFLV